MVESGALTCRTCGATPGLRGDQVSNQAVAYTCSRCLVRGRTEGAAIPYSTPPVRHPSRRSCDRGVTRQQKRDSAAACQVPEARWQEGVDRRGEAAAPARVEAQAAGDLPAWPGRAVSRPLTPERALLDTLMGFRVRIPKARDTPRRVEPALLEHLDVPKLEVVPVVKPEPEDKPKGLTNKAVAPSQPEPTVKVERVVKVKREAKPLRCGIAEEDR